MKDPKQFRERFKKWKEGTPIKEIYDNGRPTEYIEYMKRLAQPMAKNWEISEKEAYVHLLNDDSYDYYGWWKDGGKNIDPNTMEAAKPPLLPNDDGHFPDTYKTAKHPTFSNQSKYSGVVHPKYNPLGIHGGAWLGDTYLKGPMYLPGYSGGKDDRTYLYATEEPDALNINSSNRNIQDAVNAHKDQYALSDNGKILNFMLPEVAISAPYTGRNKEIGALLDNPQALSAFTNRQKEFAGNVNQAMNRAAPKVLDLLTAIDGVAGGVDLLEGMYNLGKWANNAITTSQWIPMQYVRYGLGKGYNWLHGRNVELPTIYRRVKALPQIEGNKVVFTNPDSRFAFINGEPSPNITNMTTDMGVLAHASGDWDEALTLATSGRRLLGKNVVSTKPMDTFTYGDVIKVPKNKVSLISGDPQELLFAQQNGINAITTDDLLQAYNDVIKSTKSIKQGRFSLVKQNWSPYAKKSNEVLRSRFKSPTVDDYKFMDYVFNPKYRSEVYPIEEDLFNLAINDAKFGEIFGNSTNRGYLEDKSRWGNVIYDPSPSIEAQFRKAKGIDLRKYIPINTSNRYLGYVSDYDWANGINFSYTRGKDSGIYIKPSKRGTFTAAAKKRGMSVQSFASKVLNNPSNYSKAMRKKAQFAKNASKFKH